MVLRGFKSFADTVTIEFDRGVTCVVGPNGSGKSNISDALRWVLGEQSAKMLRGGRMDEVIFAGSATRKPAGIAEVTLEIDNSDGELKIEFTDVAITRRMYRSGESEYYINDSQCRLKDIRELIMDTGIGVDGYSIIGQGKISEIINGKPENMREIFEEAAGIVKYRAKKAEAEKNLELTKVNLDRVGDIASELESRLEPLKRESKKAREYLKLSEEYRINEVNLFLKRIEDTERANEYLKKDIEAANVRIEELEAERSKSDSAVSEAKKRLEALEEQDFAERDKIMSYRNEINDLENQIRIAEGKIGSTEESSKVFEEERVKYIKKLEEEEIRKKELIKKIELLEGNLEKSESVLADMKKESETLKNDSDSSAARFQELRESLYEINSEASTMGAELEGLKKIESTLKDRKKQLTDAMEADKADAADEHEYNLYLQRRNSLTEKRGEADSKKKGLEEELQRIKESGKKQREAVERNRIRLKEEETKKEMLENLEDSYEGYNHAVKTVMKDSRLSGMYGTVGELIHVPRNLENAIEAALGLRIQNIICSDNSAAGEAVALLKSRKAGRLTFLPAEDMVVYDRRSTSTFEASEGYVGVAADCVRFEPKYRKPFEYLLGGIIIVDTLKNALAMKNKGGFRFVTLDGELVNPSGAITGGASKNNYTGILERKNRLGDAERIVFSISADLEESENRLKETVDSEERVSVQIRELEEAVRNYDIEITDLTTKTDFMAESMRDFSEREERNKRELMRTDDELYNTMREISMLEDRRRQLLNTIERISGDADSLVSVNDAFTRRIDEMSSNIEKTRSSVEQTRGELDGSREVLNRSSVRIGELKEDIRKKEEDIAKLELDRASFVNERSDAEKRLRMKQQIHNDHDDVLKTIRAERAGINENINRIAIEKETLDKKYYEQLTVRETANNKIEANVNRIDSLKNSMWDEFSISYVEALGMKEPTFGMTEGQKESKRLKHAIKELGNVNPSSIEEYEQVSERYSFIDSQRRDLVESSSSLKKIIEETDINIKANFKASFDSIRMNFGNIFSELFIGGKGTLQLDDPSDPLGSGIEIVVQPPGKKLQNMNLLSGGEKTLTAIALMFAVLKAKPTPLCILDEVEAALDEANIVRFADYLKNFENIQFVLVTHQKVTMEHANVLYGITMPENGVSKVLSLKLADAEQIEGLD